MCIRDSIDDDGYKVTIAPTYGDNGFTDINGNEVQDYLGDRVTLALSLIDVPHEAAARLAGILAAESVTVDYTTPAPDSRVFKKTSYSANCSDSDPANPDPDNTGGVTWDIDVTLESILTADSGDRL